MEITRGHSGPWFLTDPHSPVGQAAQRALREAFGKDPALIREGGSIPIVSQFRTILGVETLLLGLALPDCRAHSPNENFPLENLDAGIRINKAVARDGMEPALTASRMWASSSKLACITAWA